MTPALPATSRSHRLLTRPQASYHGLILDTLYHWAPAERRPNIKRRGLLNRTPSGSDGEDGPILYAVCTGTDPVVAWNLSGGIQALPGERWDLWSIDTHDDDHYLPIDHQGPRLYEVRILNPVPYRRLWLVGTRTVGGRRWAAA